VNLNFFLTVSKIINIPETLIEISKRIRRRKEEIFKIIRIKFSNSA
jgi:hypothetical protein